MIVRRLLFLFLSCTLLATACSDDGASNAGDTDPDAPVQRNDDGEVVVDIDGDEVVLTSRPLRLHRLRHPAHALRTEAAERVGPYGFDSGGWYGGPTGVAASRSRRWRSMTWPPIRPTSPPPRRAPGACVRRRRLGRPTEGVDFSGTNVQELGVDEADIVKTDGERVYVLAANRLTVIDAETRTELSSIELPQAYQAEMFLAGDEILVIGSTWLDRGFATDADDGMAIEESWYGTSIVRLTRISVAGADAQLIESIVIEGDYVSVARSTVSPGS